MNIVLTGGPDYNDWETFRRCMDRIPLPYGYVTFLCGNEGECDRLARRYADEKGAKCWAVKASKFLEPEDSFRIRNLEMIQIADGVILFWDGKSPETGHLLSVARLGRRRILVFDYYGKLILNEGKDDDSDQQA